MIKGVAGVVVTVGTEVVIRAATLVTRNKTVVETKDLPRRAILSLCTKTIRINCVFRLQLEKQLGCYKFPYALQGTKYLVFCTMLLRRR